MSMLNSVRGAKRQTKRKIMVGHGVGRYLFVSSKQEEREVRDKLDPTKLIKKVVTLTKTFVQQNIRRVQNKGA